MKLYVTKLLVGLEFSHKYKIYSTAKKTHIFTVSFYLINSNGILLFT